ncbi:conserved protein of unknown function [Georgfuchsia toluolica]|uniref:Uncharacterized protein n=1 Tax=Georgfuchsia toluolica TaxID=424218 RepID=A0A916J6E7_9PROT|nr:hypothetical protein [Georgfuchsia toluolica]CAG4884780.1 conserved protein of unknown function [Georgfuchsia toluolica]
MDVRPDIQLQAMIKAMIDVVLPAVDPEHKMAQEQARLVIGTLQMIYKRLPIAYRYDRDELDRYVKLSRELIAQVNPNAGGAAMTQLKALVEQGADVLERARAEPAELETAIFDLRATVGELIKAVHAKGGEAALASVRKLVLSASKEEQDRERALVVNMGFESDPACIPPPIETLLPRI